MCVIFKLVGVGDYTYKEKAKAKSKEVSTNRSKGAKKYDKGRTKYTYKFKYGEDCKESEKTYGN